MSFGFSTGDFIAAATLVSKLIIALSESSGSSHEYQQIIQDLASVRRTLLQVEQMKQANQLSQSAINGLKHEVDFTWKQVEEFLGKTEKYRNALQAGGSGSGLKDSWRKIGWSLFKKEEIATLRDVLQLRLLSINILLSTATYLVQKPTFCTNNSWELQLDPKQHAIEPDWTSTIVVFEHVGLTSGGTGWKDPMFITRTGDPARQFFRVGQVFMILWNENEAKPMLINSIADTDNAMLEDRVARQRVNLRANVYTGPYTGPATIRRFLVVHEGMRSCYCLSISTFKLTGCANQPDQENYGVIYTGSLPPDLLPGEKLSGEGGMTKSAVKVEASHPSMVLPSQARIDYRRLVEVEHGVRARNVGLVGVDSMQGLLEGLEVVRAEVEL